MPLQKCLFIGDTLMVPRQVNRIKDKAEMANNTNDSIPGKLQGLDHLRAFAIMIVFLFHYSILSGGDPGWIPDIAEFGWSGVDLFFVLSGFLISSQLFAQIKRGGSISLKQFYVKRFLRIIPAFLVTVGLYFCFPVFRERESLPPLWKFLTFTQNFGLNLKDNGTFSHCWSLCVEEHFYLFLPLFLIVAQYTGFFKKSYWLLPVLLCLGFAARMYSFNHLYLPDSKSELSAILWYKYIYYPTYNRLDGLLAGVAIAAIYQFLPKVWKGLSQKGNLLIVSGLLVLTGAYILCKYQTSFTASIFGFPLIASGYGLVVAGAISPSGCLYKWKSNATSLIAKLSYGVYLTHKGVIHVSHLLLDPFKIGGNLLFVICIATCLGSAYVLNMLVERPFMRLKNRITGPNSNKLIGTKSTVLTMNSDTHQ